MAVDASGHKASVGGFSVKYLVLSALVLQNAALILLIRYSRVMPLVNGHRYYPSTAVLLTEIVKLSFFIPMALYDITSTSHAPETSTVGELGGSLSRAVFTGDSWKMAIPALLYTLQNSLQYVAASNLDTATFSLTYQLKLVTAAAFGMLFLRKSLKPRKWLSLGLLTLGIFVALAFSGPHEGQVLSIQDLKNGVSFHAPRSIWDLEEAGSAAAGQLNKRSATYEGIQDDVAAANPVRHASVGVAAAVVSCLTSGLAGSYFERVLKSKEKSRTSVWVRNVQLSFYSLWPALFLGVLFKDGEHISRAGFFSGYNWVVLTLVALQAAGGAGVALAISHTDNATKSLATSASFVITLVASAAVLEVKMNFMYLLGSAITVLAAYGYSTIPDEKKARPPPINVTQYEKSEEPGYFDIESVATAGKSPLRDPLRDALSTSRPGTPTYERRHPRSKSKENRLAKREL